MSYKSLKKKKSLMLDIGEKKLFFVLHRLMLLPKYVYLWRYNHFQKEILKKLTSNCFNFPDTYIWNLSSMIS